MGTWSSEGTIYEEIVDGKLTRYRKNPVDMYELVDGKIAERCFLKKNMEIELKGESPGYDGYGKKFHELSNNVIYEGEFKDMKRDGKGKEFYRNHGFYEGEFKDDKRHGTGILYDFRGKKLLEGHWLDGNIISRLTCIPEPKPEPKQTRNCILM